MWHSKPRISLQGHIWSQGVTPIKPPGGELVRRRLEVPAEIDARGAVPRRIDRTVKENHACGAVGAMKGKPCQPQHVEGRIVTGGKRLQDAVVRDRVLADVKREGCTRAKRAAIDAPAPRRGPECGAARLARKTFSTTHPFATRKIYTDGKAIFAGLTPEPEDADVIALVKNKEAQVIFGAVFQPFLDDMGFDPKTGMARRWWPMGRDVPVVLDPLIAFGAPVMDGTRIQTYIVAGMATRGSAREASDAYGVSPRHVNAAVEFEQQLRDAA